MEPEDDDHWDDERHPPVKVVDCEMCAGSGEGYRPGSSCRHCRGSGEKTIEVGE